MNMPSSLFDRVINRPRSPWVILGVALFLFSAPFVASYAEGSLNDLLNKAQWHGLLIPPTIIIYILIVAQRLSRMEDNVIQSVRPIVLVDDDSFTQLVDKAAYIKLHNELIAIGVGFLAGILSAFGSSGGSFSWVTIVWILSTILMFGLLAWTIYISLASTRVTSTLLRQPLHVDPFDITPFEVIGRSSLLLSLVFIGGITLSLVFIAFEIESLLHLEFWLTYIPLVLVPVLIFFLNMYPTHRVLATAKAEELETVQRHIQRSCRNLLERMEKDKDTGNLPAEINALIAYDQQLQETRTWPYNTRMLSTLFFSIIIPAITVLVRVIFERLFY